MTSPATASPPGASSLTPQQELAVQTRAVSVVLSSGAGCGKTHVLTERYLSHLREGAEVGEVVAITFTDRAARQMRARIRKAVKRHVREAETDEAAEGWARHLRGLESAPISTIHAFCGNLLRQYALDAGLDPRFEVLEEVLAFNLRSEASTGRLQELLLAVDDAGKDLQDLILLHGWRQVTLGVDHLLRELDESSWRAWLSRPDEEIAAEWRLHAREVVLPRHLEHELATRPVVARCLALLRDHPPLPGPMVEGVNFLLSELHNLPRAADPAELAEQLAKAASVGRVGAKAWPEKPVYEQVRDTFESLRGVLRGLGLEAFTAGEELVKAVEVGKRFLRVALEVAVAYRERKRQTSVLDFQDLLVLSRDLLRDNQEVRSRLHERFRHLLIDELQDTDPVQMELVEYLAGGGLTAGKLFAVGDHKQSIYRFRGADVTLFQRLRSRVPHDGRQALTVNFRSQPQILHFANALLGASLDDYEPLVPHQPQVSPGPCVEFLWTPSPEGARAGETRRAEAHGLAARLKALIGSAPLVVDREGGGEGRLRPVRAGDVVLLFRAMSNVHVYEAALREAGLDYYLVGGRAFYAQQEIYDVLNVLRAVENPHDEVSLAGVLRSPLCCLSDEAIYLLSRDRAGLWHGLLDPANESQAPPGQGPRLGRAREMLLGWRAVKDRLSIAGLLGRILDDSGFDAAVRLEFLGERKLANLWKLVDLARTFDRTGLFGLAEFIARLDDLVARQPREEQAATLTESADVVRMMTIHQAKGLEFPVVVVPDLAALPGAPHSPVAEWDRHLGCVARVPADDEEETPPFPHFGHRLWRTATALEEWREDLRTLYVACTRPQDYLILSAALPPGYEPAGPWMLTLAERFDLASGCCKAPLPADEAVRVHVEGR